MRPISKRPLDRITCPLCERRVAGFVPAGGDGSAVRPVRHKDLRKWPQPLCEGRFETVVL